MAIDTSTCPALRPRARRTHPSEPRNLRRRRRCSPNRAPAPPTRPGPPPSAPPSKPPPTTPRPSTHRSCVRPRPNHRRRRRRRERLTASSSRGGESPRGCTWATCRFHSAARTRALFATFGPLVSCHLVLSTSGSAGDGTRAANAAARAAAARGGVGHRGYGFVEYASRADADAGGGGDVWFRARRSSTPRRSPRNRSRIRSKPPPPESTTRRPR